MSLEVPDGVAGLPDGPQRRRQDDAAQRRHGPAAAAVRARSASTASTSPAAAAPAGPAGHRLRAPGPPGVPAPDRAENLAGRRRARARRGDAAAIDEALDLFPALRTLLDRPAGLLRGGQAQQLAIARALVTRPRLLVLDEPTEGIQPSIILEIEDAIAELHRRPGMAILLVEQYVEFALRLADRYAVMDGGRIVRVGRHGDGRHWPTFAGLLGV